MSTVSELDLAVAAHDLNQHPFYRAWREGTLPRETLARYAAEYGRFIAAVPEGWAALGYDAHAEEERHHVELWSQFKSALAARADRCEEVDALVSETSKAFASRATAIGALYAFEAQQPATSKSKLDGLREHYDVGAAGEAYFELHAGDYGERDMLVAEMMKLSADDGAIAVAACARTCRAMWRALDGVHGAESCAGTLPA
jgi:pyrroloquinoline-quinone synthase